MDQPRSWPAAVACAAALVACAPGVAQRLGRGQPRIDAGDYDASLARVRASLSQRQQRALTEALSALLLVEVRTVEHPAENWEKVDSALVAKIDGKTAAQVIALADRARAEHAPIFREANETSAALALELLANAQNLFRMARSVDCDGDGRGEFGYLGELSGQVGVRGPDGTASGKRLEPRGAPAQWGPVADACIRQLGYRMQVYLPGKDGDPRREAKGGGVSRSAPDPEAAETYWCAYCWPEKHGESGERVFFICQDGRVLVADNARTRYSGTRRRPAPGAAYPPGTRGLAHSPGDGGEGNDHQQWRLLEPRPPAGPDAAPAPRFE